MADIKSDNPENTSGKLNKPVKSLTYPLNETLSATTRLRFVEYSRFNPSNDVSERTTAVITLPLPVTVPENYSIATQQADLGIYGNISKDSMEVAKEYLSQGLSKIGDQAATEFTDATRAAIQGEMEGLGVVAAAINSNRFKLGRSLLGLGAWLASRDVQQAVTANLGVIRNPHTALMFEGVGLRQINLEWRFSPRSEDESRTLRQIQNTIKSKMHPAELLHGFALDYPDLVYIEFNGKPSEYLPKFEKALITNFNMTPDSSGGMALYKSGAPVSYNMQLTAVEISVLTRDIIDARVASEEESNNLSQNQAGTSINTTPIRLEDL